MADKENAAPTVAAAAAAVGPRVTRAAAKRAAAEAAAAGPAKRKRVALRELPAVTNAPASRPAKPSKPAKKAARKPPAAAEPVPADPAPPSPPPDSEPDSSASSSSPPPPPPPRSPAEADPKADPAVSASSSPPPRAPQAEADPKSDPAASASSSSAPRRAPAEADPKSNPTASTSFSSPPPPSAGTAEVDPSASATSPAPPFPAIPALADVQLCPAYASDIYSYLRGLEAEPRRRPRADYIETVQKDISASMRAILVDWLVEVAEEYRLVADTLYLAVHYIDRYLSANALGRSKLQLLGVAAMLVAAKYEEISPPHVEDFCYITDNTYTKQELLQMEGDILKLLKFELGNPTIKTFLRRFTRAAHEDNKRTYLLLEFLGSYLAELSLLDYGCLQYLPSLVAASVVFLARLTIDPHSNPWDHKMRKLTGYKASELKDCIVALHSLQLSGKYSAASQSTAIRDKYEQHKFKCVSKLLPPLVFPVSYFEDSAE